ncbi:MAG: lipid-A-disaccharide synthase [Planctomycetes bacterium]|nr:lipid-A-disaccharide synthase [Planctomycetota bacterium]
MPDALNPGPRILISAGEPSGDLHAANLVGALRDAAPGAQFAALGGGKIETAGALLLHNMLGQFAVMGLVDAFRVVRAVTRVRNDALAFVDSWKPHAAVLVDYPGFNINFAKHLKRRGIPVFYYICPQVWAWAPWRIRKIARRIDKALVVFPFEEELYRRHGIDVSYVGHPLGDVFAARELEGRFIEEGPLAGAGLVVSLLPGSRTREIERGFPVKVAAARRIREELPEATFAVPVVKDEHARLVERLAGEGGLDCRVFVGRTYEIMKMSHFALATSGTATLELAHFGVPMVVLYRTSAAGVLTKKLLLTTPHICLVNIIAGRRVVPELVYCRNHAEKIADMALEIIRDAERLEKMKQEIAAVAARIDSPGASRRAAGEILTTLTLNSR